MDRDDRLLAYMQNRLSPAARVAFEDELVRNPGLRAEHAAMRAADALGATPVPEGVRSTGRARPADSIEADRAPRAANDNRGLALLRVAVIVAATVVVWQFAVVPQLAAPETGGFVPASEVVTPPTLLVAFTDDATLVEITALLRETGAKLVDGPSAQGLYTLGFTDAAALEAAEAALGARPELVITVSRP